MARGSPFFERANYGLDTLVRAFASGAYALSNYEAALITDRNAFYLFLCEVRMHVRRA